MVKTWLIALVGICVVAFASANVGSADPEQDLGKWLLYTPDPWVEDDRFVVYTLAAESRIRNSLFAYLPQLVVACDDGETLDAYFVTGFDKPQGEKLGQVEASVQLDAETAVSMRFAEGRPGGTLRAADSDAFVGGMIEHDSLMLQFTPYLSTPKTTSFSIGGLKAVLTRMAEVCDPPVMARLREPEDTGELLAANGEVGEAHANGDLPAGDAPIQRASLASDVAGDVDPGSLETEEGEIDPTSGDKEPEQAEDPGSGDEESEDAPSEREARKAEREARKAARREARLESKRGLMPATRIPGRSVQPRYPPTARNAGIEGRVKLQYTVTPKGTVTNVVVIEGAGDEYGFDQAAIDAVSKWRYAPAKLDGIPIEQTLTVVIEFRD